MENSAVIHYVAALYFELYR